MTDIKELKATSIEYLRKKGDDLPSKPAAEFFSKVQEYDDKVLDCAMGPLGVRLSNISKKVDHQHPEIGQVLNGIFADEEMSKKIIQYLQLADFAVKEKLDIVQLYRSTLTKAPSALRSLDEPENNNHLIRLLADRAVRDELRNKKEARPVEMRYFLRKGKAHWDQLSENFAYYVRFSDAYKKDLEEAQSRMDAYKALGCSFIQKSVETRLDSFKGQMEDSLCGFHKVKMSEAAVIVGKYFGATTVSSSTSGLALIIGSQKIRNYIYTSDDDLHSKMLRQYAYETHAYPYKMLEDIASEQTKEAIEYVESLPENNGKPFFDHYVVLVPSSAYPATPNKITYHDSYYTFVEKGKARTFKDKKECMVEMDRAMIQNGDTQPVILGERDGECYFICYWI